MYQTFFLPEESPPPSWPQLVVGHDGIKIVCGSKLRFVLVLGVGCCIGDDFLKIDISFVDDEAVMGFCLGG